MHFLVLAYSNFMLFDPTPHDDTSVASSTSSSTTTTQSVNLTSQGQCITDCQQCTTPPANTGMYFLCPGSNGFAHIVFVLSVYLYVVNFNLPYNVRTLRDRYFIYGMHTPLMILFK